MSEWQPLLVEMTGYCPCEICCPGTSDGRTANNTDTRKVPYNLAGDIYNFKMGVEIFVPIGYDALDKVRATARVFKVDDRGGGLNTEASNGERLPRLDLRFKEHVWAKKFGRKRFIVFIRQPQGLLSTTP
jgi:hypothetical protein